MFGSMFKKKAAATKASMSKIENRDLMEALVGGSVMVMYADGTAEASELEKLERLIQCNDKLKHFGGEINTCIAKFTDMFSAGALMGKVKAMRELDDIKADPEDIEEVFVMMVEIALADGEIDDKEAAILKEVGQKLGVRVSDYGL